MLQTSEDSPSPQDYGFPENPTKLNVRTWDNQERFLSLYATRGKKILSAKSVGLHPTTILHWEKFDVFSFQKRLELAHNEYVERLEQEFQDWRTSSKHNVQISYIFDLKAEAPEKYREDVKIQGLEPLTQLLEEARKLAARDIQKRQGLEQGAAEGSFRDLDAYNKEAE